jgi:hypothetical protein
LASAGLFPLAGAAGLLAVRGFSRVRFASVLVARVGTALCVLGGLALCAAVALLVIYWDTFEYLPWRVIATLGGAVRLLFDAT